MVKTFGLDDATMERIREEVRALTPLRSLLTLLAALLFSLGWLAARVLLTLWLGLAWAYAAVVVGWKSAAAGRKGDG